MSESDQRPSDVEQAIAALLADLFGDVVHTYTVDESIADGFHADLPDVPTGGPPPRPPKFEPGRVVTTRGLIEHLSHAEICGLVTRHLSGDWGECDRHDARANEAALRHGDRILSVYTVKGERVYVLTEADRSHTTAMLASEY